MKMEPISKLNGLYWTPGDLQKKFNRSWVLVQAGQDTAPRVYYIEDMGAAPNIVYAAPLSLNGKYKAEALSKYPMKEFFLVQDRPDPCATNYGNTAILFRYNPERQWRRGVGAHNSFIYDMEHNELIHNSSWRGDLATAIFYPEHTPLPTAMEQIRKGECVARAISNLYTLAKGDGKTLNLYRRRLHVGSYVGSKLFQTEGAGKILAPELEKEIPLLKEKYA